jgi:flavin reductase (DIM6/NTAB) family NADH-FMN oxidoreductase RutF
MMVVATEMFREVFRRWPSGVSVTTTRVRGRAHGMVVGSLCSLSAEPPLVMFSAGEASRTRALVEEAGFFAASILAHDQQHIFARFAGHDPEHDDDRFAGLLVTEHITGAPIFPQALAWVDCRVVERHHGTTYTIFVGEVVAAGLGQADEQAPLVYFRRHCCRLLGPETGRCR